MFCRFLIFCGIFLIHCSFALADRSCLVGGSSSSADNAGWYDPALADKSDVYGSNGAAVYSANGDAITDMGGGTLRVTGTSGLTTSHEGIYVRLYNFGDTTTDKLVIVDTVNVSPNWFEVTETQDTSPTTCDVDLGGAVPATYNVVAYDLEDVLDDSIGSAASNNVFIYLYSSGTVDITESVMFDIYGGTGQYRKNLIGCDVSYGALTTGNYILYDPGGTDDINDSIFTISVENITIENIAAANPSGSSAPSSGEHCFDVTAVEFVARNCRAVNGYYGFLLSDQSGTLIDCVAWDNRISEVILGLGATILGGYFEKDRTKSYGFSDVIQSLNYSPKIIGATIVGGQTGIYIVTQGSQLILNCNFKDQTVQAVNVSHANAVGLIFNNIFKLADSANDYAITITAGSVYEDYNVTNATAANSGFAGANSVSGLALSDTNPWVDASKNTDDYRLNRSAGLIGNVLEAGWAPYMFTGIIGTGIHKMSIGAYMTYDLPEKANVDSSDTVYGKTGTAAGGGGIKVHPGMTGGIGG